MDAWNLVLSAVAIVGGLYLLIKSSDWFVTGAAATASHLGISEFIIGMIIVGFGTSAPEMLVSANAALDNSPGIALGNAFGSDIANIALILGVTALISPVLVRKQIFKRELPILAVTTIIAAALLLDGDLTRTESFILLAIFAVSMAYSIAMAKKEDSACEEEIDKSMSLKKALAYTVGGLAILALSSKALVWGAVNIATALHVSEMIIGLTIVAIGTSLPELATSITAARKGNNDLAVGNIVGSNLFNTLAVTGIAGSISPFTFDPVFCYRDVGLTVALTATLFIFGFPKKGESGLIGKKSGLLWVLSYSAYTAWLVYEVIKSQNS